MGLNDQFKQQQGAFKQLSGADVPAYVERGFVENDPAPHRGVVAYSAVGALLTVRAWLTMTGQAEDLQ